MVNLLEQAQTALQQEDWSLVNQSLRQLLDQNHSDSDQPGACLEQALSLALEVLEAGDFQDRWGIAKLFPRLGPIAIPPLIAILKDEAADLEHRWFVARILGEFNHPVVVTALVDLLQTPEDEDLSEMAAAALANLGPATITALSNSLTEEHSRLLAVRSLAQIRRTETIEPLLSVVRDPQVIIRATAIEALSSFHDPRIHPILIHALDDPAAPVRQVAVMGLGLRSDLLEQLDLVGLIQPLLWDFDLDVCQQAATALGRLGTQSATAGLFQALMAATTPVPLQIRIIRALGWIETASGLACLQQALMLEAEVCQESVTVLGQAKQPELRSKAAKILVDLLHSNHSTTRKPTIKQAICLSLGELGETSATKPLIQLLADSNTGVRLHAIAALKKLAPQTAYYELESLAKAENIKPELQQGIVIAIREWSI